MAAIGFGLFFLSSGVGCLLALGFGAFSLVEQWREVVLARYPLQVVSWIIATPFFGLSTFGVIVGFSALVGADGGDAGGGFWRLGLITLALAALCVVAVVVCSRAARGKCASGPATPAILGFGTPLLVAIPPGFVNEMGYVLILALLLSVGAGVNGLLAISINSRRRGGLLPGNPNATFPPPVAQASLPLSTSPPAERSA